MSAELWTDVLLAPGECLPHPRNPKRHPPEQIERIRANIRELGFTRPILVTHENLILAGHGAVEAAALESIALIPARRRSEAFPLSSAQQLALMVADNRLAENGEWDNRELAGILAELELEAFPLDMVGFSMDEANALWSEFGRGAPGGAAGGQNQGQGGAPGTGEPLGPSGAGSLAERFLLPPFSVLNARDGWWQQRKAQWLALGIRSEIGREANLIGRSPQELFCHFTGTPYAEAREIVTAAMAEQGDAFDVQALIDKHGRKTDRLAPGGTGANSAWLRRGADGYAPTPGGINAEGAAPPRVALCSLRNGLQWNPPAIGCIQDAFFSLLKQWLVQRGIAPGFYNVGWNGEKPKRDDAAIKAAEWVFLFSSNEFVYHDSGVINPMFVASSNEKIADLLPLLDGKRLVIFSMDSKDTAELLLSGPLKGADFEECFFISEQDFPTSVQSVRYGQLLGLDAAEKALDFAYWGTTKRKAPGGESSGDARYDILRGLFNHDDVTRVLAGNDFGKHKADYKFDTHLRGLAPELSKARATCCFQWPGFGHHITARYHEAMALRVIPFVHADYDTQNQIVASDWQRISSAAELREKILELRDPAAFARRFDEVLASYERRRPSDAQQYEQLVARLDSLIPKQRAAAEEGGGSGTSIFDPVLCELAYRWFCPPGGAILDPFSGGSVRGIVAGKLGRAYVGIELRRAQITANEEQALTILGADGGEGAPGASVSWHELDAVDVSGDDFGEFDFVFTCPPYFDLERYSDDPRDLSNMEWPQFVESYTRAIKRACALLREDRFACFVVGEVRDRAGNYRGLVPETIRAFEAAGLSFYNEAILVTAVGSLPIRAGRTFAASRKLGKTHQNVLVFVKGDGGKAAQACGPVEVPEEAFLAAISFGEIEAGAITPEQAEELMRDDGPRELVPLEDLQTLGGEV